MWYARMAGTLAAAYVLAVPAPAAADQTLALTAPPGGTLGAPVVAFTATPAGAKAPLLVDWSVDGGSTWTLLASIASAPPRDWQFYEFAIAGASGAAGVLVRFRQADGWMIRDAVLRDMGGGGAGAVFEPPIVAVAPITTDNPAPGLTTVTFTVTLDHPTTVDVTVDWEVRGADGSLVAAGTLTVPAGQTSATASVTGSVALEPFAVNLFNVQNATLGMLAASLAAPLSSQASLGALQGGPGAPERGKSFLLTAVSGSVRYHPAGQPYVALPAGSVLLPFGSVVDTANGRARLTVASDAVGTLQSSEFYSGAFGVFQPRTAGAVSTMRLAGGDYSKCTAASAGRASAAGRRVVRRLWGSGRGSFRTQGRFASATVRGTVWKTEDLCQATRVTVAQGAVTVRDFRRDRTVVVRAGHSYTVEALRSGRFRRRTGLNKPSLARVSRRG
jgi:hypothetical protein